MAEAVLNIEKHFMLPQYEVIADYPEPKTGPHHKKGDIIRPTTLEYCDPYKALPGIFREMKWHEKRTLNEFLHIKNIEVVNPSYYVKGDRIAVTSYMWEGLDTVLPRIVGFYIGGSFRDGKNIGGHQFKLEDCFPVQKAEKLN